MPNYKYTVANPQGKRLGGTVEAPDEKTARQELNNLGFSIIELQESSEILEQNSDLKKFIFEAVDKNAKLVSGTIPAESSESALARLKDEYLLQVTGIWEEGSTEEQIAEAKSKISQDLSSNEGQTKEQPQNLEQLKIEQKVRTKIEYILGEVSKLLKIFDEDFDAQQKAEINKRINKILRIKNSKNTQYILSTAEELLEYIQEQEKVLKEKGFQDKRLNLHVRTKNLINNLNSTNEQKSLSEDIISKIENWQTKHQEPEKAYIKVTSSLLSKIKALFTTPPEIQAIKNQIKIYNRQLIDFTILYFREPTKQYKNKVKASLKGVWNSRKKAIHSLNHAKSFKKKRFLEEVDSSQFKASSKNALSAFTTELNSFTGWLLAFYIIYYFTAIYLTTKDFGLTSIPKAFYIYESNIFKYILSILFLLHAATSLKINFFQKNLAATITLPIVFVIGTIVVLLNF